MYILDANCNICGLPRPFSRKFRSVPSFGISSSAELGMPRNEHFLPRNNGNRSESIPRNFFGTIFRSQPYSKLAGSKNVMQTVYYSTSLVLKSRVLLMSTDTVEELPGYPVQNSPSGSFLF